MESSLRSGRVERARTAVAGGDEQPDAFELWCEVVRVVLLPGIDVCIRIIPKCQRISTLRLDQAEIAPRLIVGQPCVDYAAQ